MAAKEYTDRELFRMQQDAVERVRDMQSRSNQAMGMNSRFNPPPGYISPNFNNWSTNPGIPKRSRREGGSGATQNPGRQERPTGTGQQGAGAGMGIDIPEIGEQQAYPVPPPAPEAGGQQRPVFPPEGQAAPPSPPPGPGPTLPPPAEGEKTTVLQDILGGIGLDDDRLLIIGLLFILINAKADTTLILALMYLLI